MPNRRIPKRRFADYKSYKKWLREDFQYQCAYCFIHEKDHGGFWHFQVDHYRPKGLQRFKHLICDYSNLLYSCDHCNVLKGDVWPSDNPIADGIGWLDPCENDLEREHYRFGYKDGQFRVLTFSSVGFWMVQSLALDQPARISRREALAKQECLDKELLNMLQALLAQAIGANETESSDANKVDIERYTSLAALQEERIAWRSTPEPYARMRRKGGKVSTQEHKQLVKKPRKTRREGSEEQNKVEMAV